jgi:hypothetical protein
MAGNMTINEQNSRLMNDCCTLLHEAETNCPTTDDRSPDSFERDDIKKHIVLHILCYT